MTTVNFRAGAQVVKNMEETSETVSHAIDFAENGSRSSVLRSPKAGALTFTSASRPYYSKSKHLQREPNVRKIAVLRSNGIGDYIFALPALDALRAAYPEAEIVYLGLPWHAEFLKRRPGPIDRVEVVPPSQGVGYPEDLVENAVEIESFFQRMDQEKFDISIQMHGGGRYSNPFVQRLHAGLSVGCRANDAAPLDRWIPYIYYQSEILRYLEIVSLVGAQPVEIEPHLEITEADLDEVIDLLPDKRKPIAVIHPGAGDPRRRWPVDKFAEIGNALAWAGAQVVITGVESERPLVKGVIDAMSAEAFSLCGKVSLGGLTGLLSQATVVVSNDSGPLHIATALGVATVGIFWAGNLINAGPVTRSRHRPALSWRLDCPVCGLDCTKYACEHHDSFVADISTLEVKASALELFEQAVSPTKKLQPEF